MGSKRMPKRSMGFAPGLPGGGGGGGGGISWAISVATNESFTFAAASNTCLYTRRSDSSTYPSAYTSIGAFITALNRRTSSSPKMWSTWLCVKRMASHRHNPSRRACACRSGVASMSTTRSIPVESIHRTHAPVRVRVSRGSDEVHTAQSHAISGIPPEVPVPRKVKRGWSTGNGRAPSGVPALRVQLFGINPTRASQSLGAAQRRGRSSPRHSVCRDTPDTLPPR